MSDILTCIGCISKKQPWFRHRWKCVSPVYKLSAAKSNLLLSCSDFTLKPEPELAVIACQERICLAGGDALEVLYTGFVQTPSPAAQQRFPNLNEVEVEVEGSCQSRLTLQCRSIVIIIWRILIRRWTSDFPVKSSTALNEFLNCL